MKNNGPSKSYAMYTISSIKNDQFVVFLVLIPFFYFWKAKGQNELLGPLKLIDYLVFFYQYNNRSGQKPGTYCGEAVHYLSRNPLAFTKLQGFNVHI